MDCRHEKVNTKWYDDERFAPCSFPEEWNVGSKYRTKSYLYCPHWNPSTRLDDRIHQRITLTCEVGGEDGLSGNSIPNAEQEKQPLPMPRFHSRILSLERSLIFWNDVGIIATSRQPRCSSPQEISIPGSSCRSNTSARIPSRTILIRCVCT